MAFTYLGETFFFIGFLFSFGIVVSSQSNFNEYWQLLKNDYSYAGRNNASQNLEMNNFAQKVLERHNAYRQKHGVPPLTYNKRISDVSQDWANKLAANSEFKHRPNNKYGENLYYAYSSDSNFQLSPYAAVDAWYNEVEYYDFSSLSIPNIAVVGHFTQLVWKSSQELGVGVAKSKSNEIYVVCNYSPPGNVLGQFGANVLFVGEPPKKPSCITVLINFLKDLIPIRFQ